MDLLHQWMLAFLLVYIDYVGGVCGRVLNSLAPVGCCVAGKNNTQSSVYVMWDDAKSVAGPTFAGVQLGVNPPADADAAADAIAAAHAEQAAAGAQEGNFLTDLH
jgi:hypothetical protein